LTGRAVRVIPRHSTLATTIQRSSCGGESAHLVPVVALVDTTGARPRIWCKPSDRADTGEHQSGIGNATGRRAAAVLFARFPGRWTVRQRLANPAPRPSGARRSPGPSTRLSTRAKSRVAHAGVQATRVLVADPLVGYPKLASRTRRARVSSVVASSAGAIPRRCPAVDRAALRTKADRLMPCSVAAARRRASSSALTRTDTTASSRRPPTVGGVGSGSPHSSRSSR